MAEKTKKENGKLDIESLRRGIDAMHRGVGEAATVMARDEKYREMFLGDLRRLVMPPVLLNQYRIVRDGKDRTVGFAAWARVNEKTQQRLMRGRLTLKLDEWQNGDETAVMIVAAPSEAAGRKILRALQKEDFAEHKKVWVANTAPPSPGLFPLAADGDN